MYQADFICTYKLMEDEEEQECLYQIQLLQAFNLIEWDDFTVRAIIEELYNELKADKYFSLILEKVSKVEAFQSLIQMTEQHKQMDKDILLVNLLFQFDYFDLFHNCIIDFKRGGEIREKSFQALTTTTF